VSAGDRDIRVASRCYRLRVSQMEAIALGFLFNL
jgi:hypothetical protein